MKWLIVALLAGVLAALAGAGVFMLRRKPEPAGTDAPPDRRMARALALRVALSILAFGVILLSWTMGWIQPTGIPSGR
jgi:hypothetical protein